MGAEQWITGMQHIGIPTSDLKATIAFYEGLGFQVTHRNKAGSGDDLVFLTLKNIVIETYETGGNGLTGAINHFAMDCNDIEAAYAWARDEGYTIVSDGIMNAPFFDHGISCFFIEGPNKERIEFNQIKG